MLFAELRLYFAQRSRTDLGKLKSLPRPEYHSMAASNL